MSRCASVPSPSLLSILCLAPSPLHRFPSAASAGAGTFGRAEKLFVSIKNIETIRIYSVFLTRDTVSAFVARRGVVSVGGAWATSPKETWSCLNSFLSSSAAAPLSVFFFFSRCLAISRFSSAVRTMPVLLGFAPFLAGFWFWLLAFCFRRSSISFLGFFLSLISPVFLFRITSTPYLASNSASFADSWVIRFTRRKYASSDSFLRCWIESNSLSFRGAGCLAFAFGCFL